MIFKRLNFNQPPDINIALISLSPHNYIGFKILHRIVFEHKFGFPRRYAPTMDLGMRMIHLLHYLAYLTAPSIVIIIPLADYFSFHNWSELSRLDWCLLIFWSVVLMISTQKIVSVNMLLIQHCFFLNCYFRGHFMHLKSKFHIALEKIGRTKKKKICKSIKFC